MKRIILPRFGTILFWFVVVLLFVIPIGWMIATSLLPPDQILRTPPSFKMLTLSNFKRLINDSYYGLNYLNSIIVSISATFGTVGISLLTAYGLLKLPTRTRTIMKNLILLSYMISPIVILIPLYLLGSRIGMIDTLAFLTFTCGAFFLPLCILIMESFFETVPKEMIESAQLDKASDIRIINKIIIPKTLPGIVACGFFVFILVWNDYIFTSLLINSNPNKTLSLWIYGKIWTDTFDWGLLMAGSTLAVLPAVIVFFLSAKYLFKGWQFMGAKG